MESPVLRLSPPGLRPKHIRQSVHFNSKRQIEINSRTDNLCAGEQHRASNSYNHKRRCKYLRVFAMRMSMIWVLSFPGDKSFHVSSARLELTVTFDLRQFRGAISRKPVAHPDQNFCLSKLFQSLIFVSSLYHERGRCKGIARKFLSFFAIYSFQNARLRVPKRQLERRNLPASLVIARKDGRLSGQFTNKVRFR